MPTKIIRYCFYILLLVTPLIFTRFNYELFEYNKMMLVYGLTVIITASWLIKMLKQKQLIFKRTPLDIFLLSFLVSQILSTIFSIDTHTSIWGYYSRSNGGLLSIISYLLLYWAFVSNFNWQELGKFLKMALVGGVLVSLWAVPEHFGHSFSCLILQGDYSDSCWVQEVQARVFATLGQPNWLAAYLEMLIFIVIYFVLTAKSKLSFSLYLFSLILFYLAFTFTYSRGATLGLLAGILTLVMGLILINFNKKIFAKPTKVLFGLTRSATAKKIVLVLAAFFIINLLFASALTSFQLVKQDAAPVRPGLVENAAPSGTQLENGGTESGQIRLIVWKGALDIFRHYPLFGTGVETFAYSYFKFRPNEHNLVSEWDFLYNKAHNEYLNYLATTGIFGFTTYLIIIAVFLFWAVKKIQNKKLLFEDKLLVISLVSGYVSYLVQNLFGFSVVMIAVLFYLFPAFAFVGTDSTFDPKFKKDNFLLKIGRAIATKRTVYPKLLTALVIIIAGYFLVGLLRFWQADALFKKGSDYSNYGNTGKGYNLIFDATKINSGEPLYKSELGNVAAVNAVALESSEATLSAALKTIAVDQTQQALSISPANVSLWRTAIRTYFALSELNKSYQQKTLEVVDHTISLAPNDPKIYHSKGVIQDQFGNTQGSIQAFEKAVLLKPNYHEALFDLGLEYQKDKQYDKATIQMEKILKLIPNDPDATKKLEELKK